MYWKHPRLQWSLWLEGTHIFAHLDRWKTRGRSVQLQPRLKRGCWGYFFLFTKTLEPGSRKVVPWLPGENLLQLATHHPFLKRSKRWETQRHFHKKKNIFAIHLAFSRSSHIYIWHFVPNKKTTPKQQKTRSFRRLYKSPIPLYHLKLDISNARAWPRLHFLGLPGPLELLQASFFAEKNRPKHHGWQARYNFCICKQLYKRLWNLRDFIMISFVICIYHVSYIFPYISFVSCFSWVACMPPDESHQIACGWILHDFRFADLLRQNWNHFGSYKPTLNSRQEKQGFHEGLCQGCDNDHILNICCLVLVYLPINIEGVNQQLVVHIGPLWGNFAGWQL